MRLPSAVLLLFLLPALASMPLYGAEPEFPLTEDSKPQPAVPKGEMLKDTYTAGDGSVFPGTQREYQIYVPHGLDRSRPAAFMVFQDGVIYQAPVVFDNLIAKKDIPPLVGIFIKPGVVPAAHENALPRYNRSHEYDSISDAYARFLLKEFLPAIEAKHGLKLSTDPNDAAISGNSSGGIAAFMVAWHHPDRFRRVFTGVGTYVGIHGGDRLSVLVRKVEPKPIRIYLQSGTGDNNLYCGDWWMANQMMERSLSWAGYEVNHAWGEGGHNQKHASQVFPEALRWLWKDWQTDRTVKANARGESKWKGYEVCTGDGWSVVQEGCTNALRLASNSSGDVVWRERNNTTQDWLVRLRVGGKSEKFGQPLVRIGDFAYGKDGKLYGLTRNEKLRTALFHMNDQGQREQSDTDVEDDGLASFFRSVLSLAQSGGHPVEIPEFEGGVVPLGGPVAYSPDHTILYQTSPSLDEVVAFQRTSQGIVRFGQAFCHLDTLPQQRMGRSGPSGLCVDVEGRIYVATPIGIQVCDQAGRVNFIIPTPGLPSDVCFGGKDLAELFIACGDGVYRRPTKTKGFVSTQMPPIKPAPPKL